VLLDDKATWLTSESHG